MEVHRRGASSKSRGFTLIEMMLVLIVVMSLMTLELKRKQAEMNEYAAIAVGRHMKTVADATNAYLVNNYGPLMAGTDPNCLPAATFPCYLNPSALVAQQILPTSFVLKTAWDSDYSIAITRVGAAPHYNLNGVVVSVLPWTDTYGAGAPKLSDLGRAVVEMGPDGGASASATEVTGHKGGWSATAVDSNKINAIGQLASRVGYASSVFAQFLRRDGTLPMTGNLSMGNNSIQQAVNVTASGAVSGNSLSGNTANIAGALSSNSISNTTSISTNDITAANSASAGLISVTGSATIGGNASVGATLSSNTINNSGTVSTNTLSSSSLNNSGNISTSTLAATGNIGAKDVIVTDYPNAGTQNLAAILPTGSWRDSVIVTDNMAVNKPNCGAGGVPIVFAIPQSLNSPNGVYNFYAQDVSASQWVVRITDGAGAAQPQGSAIAVTMCGY